MCYGLRFLVKLSAIITLSPSKHKTSEYCAFSPIRCNYWQDSYRAQPPL